MNTGRPHPQPMAAPYLELDITRELEQLHREAGWQSRQNARTLVIKVFASIDRPHSETPVDVVDAGDRATLSAARAGGSSDESRI